MRRAAATTGEIAGGRLIWLVIALALIKVVHEFGHALHGLFSNVRYPTLAGTAVPRDFVEMPSQFNEHWANEPAVFSRYARHYRTGEPMPSGLKERVDKARLFNGGYAMTELLAAAFLDLEWHQLAPDAVLIRATMLSARYRLNLASMRAALAATRSTISCASLSSTTSASTSQGPPIAWKRPIQ